MPRLKHRPSTWTLLSNYKCCPSIGFACSTSVLIKFTFDLSCTTGVIHIVNLAQEECQLSPDFICGSVELHELHKCCCLVVILSTLWINLILPLNNIPSVLYGHNPHTLTAMAVGLGGYSVLSSLFIYSSQALLSGLFGFRSSLQRRQNECGGVSNHRRIDCLLNRLFRRRSKKTSTLHVAGLREGNSSVTIWWRHHGEYSAAFHPDRYTKRRMKLSRYTYMHSPLDTYRLANKSIITKMIWFSLM